MNNLAINGGEPVRKNKIYYGCQWIDEKDIEAVVNTLSGDLITCGPKVKELDRKLEEMCDVKHAIAVSNGTAALHCACIAAGIGPGDEVITTPLTFAASSNCILYCGAKPVFADVDIETYNIDPKSIEDHITTKTKAVIAVDYTGQAVNIDEIRKICDKHNLIFIEDAAHSIGTIYKARPIGGLADITTFSFHPVKNVTAGEGGAILTNDDKLYKKALLAANHGIERDEEYMEEAPHEGIWYYEQVSLGFNYRITDFQAALLISQLGKLPLFKERRSEITNAYDKAFSGIPEIILQKELSESDTCRHLYIIRLDLDKLNCSRRQFFDAMSAEGIQPQIHYIPVYWFPYYKRLGYKAGLCPNAEIIYGGIMSIPLYPKMSNDDVKDVISAVTKIVEYYRK